MGKLTVIGGSGFIGSTVVQAAKKSGWEIYVPEIGEKLNVKDLGTVVFAAGEGDCKNKPQQVFEASTALLSEVLFNCQFDRLIYFSSTRLYLNGQDSEEGADLSICTNDGRRLFNLAKLTAEELCLRSGKDVVVLRLSNVYGTALHSPLFLPAITRHAIQNGVVDMYVTPGYAKDYVSVDDVANAVMHFAENREQLKQQIFNIASGVNVSAEAIAEVLAEKTGTTINWHSVSTVEDQFPVICTERIRKQFHFTPRDVLSDLDSMIDDFRQVLGK